MAMSVYESGQVTEYLPSQRVTLLSSAVILVVCKSWDLQAEQFYLFLSDPETAVLV